MIDSRTSWEIFRLLDPTERLALRRCASYYMRTDPSFEEIGSSDISCQAAYFIQIGVWPSAEERGDVGLGFLVDEYSQDAQDGFYPSDTLKRILHCGKQEFALPDCIYQKLHLLSAP